MFTSCRPTLLVWVHPSPECIMVHCVLFTALIQFETALPGAHAACLFEEQGHALSATTECVFDFFRFPSHVMSPRRRRRRPRGLESVVYRSPANNCATQRGISCVVVGALKSTLVFPTSSSLVLNYCRMLRLSAALSF